MNVCFFFCLFACLVDYFNTIFEKEMLSCFSSFIFVFQCVYNYRTTAEPRHGWNAYSHVCFSFQFFFLFVSFLFRFALLLFLKQSLQWNAWGITNSLFVLWFTVAGDQPCPRQRRLCLGKLRWLVVYHLHLPVAWWARASLLRYCTRDLRFRWPTQLSWLEVLAPHTSVMLMRPCDPWVRPCLQWAL